MPKKAKKKKGKDKGDGEEEEEERKIAFSLQQRVNVERLRHIFTLARLPVDEADNVSAILELYKTSHGSARIDYIESKKCEGMRLWGACAIGLRKKWICRMVAGEYYEWLDIKNAACTLLTQDMAKNGIEVPALIARYVQPGGREAMIAELCAQLEWAHDDAGKKRGKDAFLAVINGKGVQGDPELNCEILREWKKNWQSVLPLFVMLARYGPMWQAVQQQTKKSNKEATFLSYVWQSLERRIMETVVEYLHSLKEGKNRLYNVGVWKHDEIGVERRWGEGKIMTDELVRQVQEHVKQTTGYEVSFHSDDGKPTDEDWDLYYGEQHIHKLASNEEKCRHDLIKHARRSRDIRFDGQVFGPHARIEGVFCFMSEAEEYMDRVLADADYYHSVNKEKLLKWFVGTSHRFFPVKRPSEMRTDWISFRNCTFNSRTLAVRTWEQLRESSEAAPFTDHFYDVEVDIEKMMKAMCFDDDMTPEWRDLLRFQLSKPMYEVFETLLGRLQFPLRERDNWQVFPFMLGDAGTGKGTVIQVLQSMKPPGKVASISKNTEKGFGLSSLYDKELIVIPDLPLDFASTVDQATLQSMVSGEMVNVPAKNKIAKSTLLWRTAVIVAGNYLFNYKDGQGQLKRRLALFLYNELVKTVDSGLGDRIIKNEMPYILARCVARYKRAVEEHPQADFWVDIAPEELRQNQKYVESRTNVLARFLNEGSKDYGVVFEKNHFTSWQDFSLAVDKYLKEDCRLHNVTVDDLGDTALRRSEYEVYRAQTNQGVVKKDTRVNYCEFCPRSTKEVGHICDVACEPKICGYVRECGHTGVARGRKHGIVHMRLLSRRAYDQKMNGATEEEAADEDGESAQGSQGNDRESFVRAIVSAGVVPDKLAGYKMFDRAVDRSIKRALRVAGKRRNKKEEEREEAGQRKNKRQRLDGAEHVTADANVEKKGSLDQ